MQFHQERKEIKKKLKDELSALIKNRDKIPTIDINDAGTMTNKSIWCLENII